MATRAKLFSQLAKSVDTSGTITSAGISSTVSLGATVYDSAGQLPTSGYNPGDQAFVISTSRLYINSGVGWYNVAVINNTPIVQSILDSDGGTTPFALATDGTPTTITITAVDSDGDSLTYSSTADSDFGGLATISQADNVFTITPFSQDSATTSSGTITFSITDGINIANSGIQTFTLFFVSPLWDETVLSIGTSSTNSLDNSTFIDRSTNAHTVTTSGSPVQTAFHPYHDNWSVEFDGGSSQHVQLRSYSSTPLYSSNDDLTIECWVYSRTSSVLGLFDGTPSQAGGIRNYPANAVAVVGGTSCTFTLPTFEWAHFAAVFDSTSITVYINGTSSNTVSHSGYASKVNFDIGTINGGGDGKFNGYISDFRITTEKLYTSNFTPPTGKLTQLTNTTFLGLQNNRFMAADNVYGGTINAVNGAAISSYHLLGQGSEYTSGANKGSVYLNGSSSVDGGASINPSSGCCIEGWAYITSVSSFAFFFSTEQGNSGFYPRWYVGHDNSGNWRVSPGDATDNNLTSYPLVKNQWNHWALTNDGSTSRLFVNGKLIYTKSVTPTSESLNINISKYGDSLQYTTYGYISDFRAATTIPTAYQTSSTTLDTQVFTPPSSPGGISGAGYYLPMDNAGIYDKTGNSTLTLAGNTATSTTQTKFASTSMYFDGSGDYITTDFPALGTGDFTIEFWINPSTINSAFKALMDPRVSNVNNPLVWIRNNNVIYYYANNADAILGTTTLSTGTWYHVAVSRSSGTTKLFLNGTQEGSDYSDTTSYTVDTLFIGQRYTATAYNYHGYMENFQILNGVAKYTANFTPPTSTQGRNYQAES